jgi:hypothetical protein
MENKMTILTDLFFHQTTADVRDAGTGDSFSLEIQSQGQRAVIEFPELDSDERERGSSDDYHFDLRNFNFDHELLAPGDIRVVTHGDNAWLPNSFWVTGGFGDGGNDEDVGLVYRPSWPQTNWFSTDSDEGQSSWPLDLA